MSLTKLKPGFLRTCSVHYDKVAHWNFFIEEKGKGKWSCIGYNEVLDRRFHVTGFDQVEVVATVIEYAVGIDSKGQGEATATTH